MPKEPLQFSSKYTYDRETDTYVLNFKHRVKPFVIKGYKVRAIRLAISNTVSPSETSTEICLKYKIQSDDLEALKKAFDLARDAFPITDEEVEYQPVEQSAVQILEAKRSQIAQIIEKEEWREIKKDAENWRHFVVKDLDPFCAYIENWAAPKITVPKSRLKKTLDRDLIITLTDVHGGAIAQPELMQNGEAWDKDEFLKFFESYKKSIQDKISEVKPSKLLLFSLGDILDGLRGTTEKGTRLEQEFSRDEQFDLVFNSIVDFIGFLISFGLPVEIHNCRGNHDSLSNYVMFEAIKKAFTTNSALQIFNYKTPFGVFKRRNTVFIISHGANDVIDAKIPHSQQREAYFQRIIINNLHLIDKNTNIVAIAGDIHHRTFNEYSNFDFYTVGSPSRSLYADRLNLHARPSQTLFVLANIGIESVNYVYFN